MENQKISKEDLEINKLKIELSSLQRPWWKEPKTLGAIVVFIISLAFNIFQYQSSAREDKRKDAEFKITSEKWDSDKAQLVKNLNYYIEKDNVKNKIKSDLEKVKF